MRLFGVLLWCGSQLFKFYAECRYAECRYAESRGAHYCQQLYVFVWNSQAEKKHFRKLDRLHHFF